jgi:hypothetical protein
VTGASVAVGVSMATKTFHKATLGHFKKAGTVAKEKKKVVEFQILQQNKNGRSCRCFYVC